MAEEQTPNKQLTEETAETQPNEVLTEGTDSPGDDKATEGAPESYEFNFPEGIEPNETLINAFTPLFKEMNLTQENAQKLVDKHNELDQIRVQGEVQDWDNMQKEWVNASKADTEIGGVQFMENLAVAKKAVDTYGDDALKQLFNFTGVGNHVAMVKFLYKVGKDIKEDKMVMGKEQDQPRDLAKILFPDMN